MPAAKTVVLTGGSEDPFGVSPECIGDRAIGICSNAGISERSDQMQIRTIAAAALAASVLALESPRAAAC